eukprot:scaffold7.g3378.t1
MRSRVVLLSTALAATALRLCLALGDTQARRVAEGHRSEVATLASVRQAERLAGLALIDGASGTARLLAAVQGGWLHPPAGLWECQEEMVDYMAIQRDLHGKALIVLMTELPRALPDGRTALVPMPLFQVEHAPACAQPLQERSGSRGNALGPQTRSRAGKAHLTGGKAGGAAAAGADADGEGPGAAVGPAQVEEPQAGTTAAAADKALCMLHSELVAPSAGAGEAPEPEDWAAWAALFEGGFSGHEKRLAAELGITSGIVAANEAHKGGAAVRRWIEALPEEGRAAYEGRLALLRPLARL